MTAPAVAAAAVPLLQQAIEDAIGHLRSQDADACIAACEAARRIQPDCPEALLLLGLTSLQLGEPAHAEALIAAAQERRQDIREFAAALATAKAHVGNVNDGLFYAKLATALPPHPQFPDILPPPFDNFLDNLQEAKPYLYRARAARRLADGSFGEAADAAAKQLSVTPGDPESLRLLTVACRHGGAVERAIATARALIHGDQPEPDDFCALAAALAAAGQFTEAATVYEVASRHAPDDAGVAAARAAHALHDPTAAFADIEALHQAWRHRHQPPTRPPGRRRARGAPLRVGYLGNAFHDGDLADLFGPVLRSHIANGVEVYCYTDSPRRDLVSEHLMNAATRWTDLVGVDDVTAAAILHGDALDIAIDLTGHGPGSRLLALSQCAVPVTAGWLGYPHPCGLDAHIATAAIWPDHPSPELHLLPHALVPYEPPATLPAVTDAPALSTGHLTFGFTGHLAHIGAATAAAWAEVVQAHPRSRVLINNACNLDAFSVERCYDAFSNVGLRHRVDIVDAAANFSSPFDFYHHVDIALTPVAASGIADTCRALWMGVPVLALPSDRPGGRLAAAVLTAAQCQQWIAGSAADMTRIATDLVAGHDSLGAIRAGLRQQVAASPLADVAGATRSLEAVYRRLVTAAIAD